MGIGGGAALPASGLWSLCGPLLWKLQETPGPSFIWDLPQSGWSQKPSLSPPPLAYLAAQVLTQVCSNFAM
jgi:hypothetical protein